MTMTKTATADTFSALVLQSGDAPVLVDFWAEWCAPCRAMAPALDDLAEDYDGVATIVKVDAEAEAALAADHAVKGLPTLIVFRQGVECERFVGPQSRTRLAAAIDALL